MATKETTPAETAAEDPGEGAQEVEEAAAEPAPAPLALHPASLPWVVLAVVFYLLLSFVPLGNPTLWGHLTYGDWILDHGRLPTADPVMPLAAGMEVFDTQWLSQTVLAATVRAVGLTGLSQLFALLGLATALMLLRVFYLQTRSRVLSIAGVLLVLALSWTFWTSFGPGSLGLLAFAVLLWLLTAHGEALEGGSAGWWGLGLGVPVLFVLWVNLDPSFAWGLAVLWSLVLGRLAEAAWQHRGARAVLTDRPLRRRLVLAELATAACLLNPYTLDVLLRTPWWPANENLRTLPEWQPLVIQGARGWAFALSALALVLALRHSRRRVPWAHGLLLLGFTAAVVLRVGMLPWYALVLAFVLLPLAADLLDRRRSPASQERRRAALRERFGRLAGPSWHYSLVALVVLWAGFAFSPLGAAVLGGTPRSPEQLLAATTPRGVTEALRANPPEGTVFSPWWWGDWLVRDGPPGLTPFVTSHIEVIPEHVWEDYLRITGAAPDWRQLFERYRIETVVLDKSQLPYQVQALRNTEDWYPAYEDPQAVVFIQVPRKGEGTADTTEGAGGTARETPSENGSASPGDTP